MIAEGCIKNCATIDEKDGIAFDCHVKLRYLSASGGGVGVGEEKKTF